MQIRWCGFQIPFYLFDLQPQSCEVKALNKANTSFALDFFKHECQEDDNKNILFSPLSISSALATVYLGAKGNTADQMAKVSLRRVDLLE